MSVREHGPLGADVSLLLHELFERHVDSHPGAIALEASDGCLTYAALDAWANRIAARLTFHGLERQDVVGVHFGRGAPQVAAMLGVSKAGGVYLPLDASYPAERLCSMAKDAHARFVLTTHHAKRESPAFDGAVRITKWMASDDGNSERVMCRAALDDLAYIIYTSGSTGRPKGVGVPHRGLCARADMLATMLSMLPSDRVLQFSSPSFDGCLFEFLASLAQGATLCVPGDHEVQPGPPLLNALTAHRITVAIFVSSVLAALPVAPLPALRALIIGAERCPPSIVRWWARGRRFWNTYGTTETTIWSTAFDVRDSNGDFERVPIGTPIRGVECVVINDAGEASPQGQVGELAIGGIGLSRGYIGQPALTAERFVPHPNASSPGARVYRTGDRVRTLADGNLDFLGRFDNQVKVRGVRIELAEIESAISRLDGVISCVASLHDEATSSELVAYIVTDGMDAALAGRWRAALERSLPASMIPSRFVILDELPLGPTGKIDRSKLSLLASNRRSEPAGPVTHTESILIGLWQEVLQTAPLGIHDDFFTIGGHSLVGARIASRIDAEFHVDVTCKTIFACRTIARLGMHVDAALAQGASHKGELEVRCRRSAHAAHLLSFDQERMWFTASLDPDRFLTIPIALRVRGPLEIETLRRAFTLVVQRHEPLRTTIEVVDGMVAQVVRPNADCPFDVVVRDDIADDSGAMERVIEAYMNAPFLLDRELPIRVRVVRLAQTDALLMIAIHHIAADRWSVAILMSELAEAYNAIREARDPRLADITFGYTDYAAWQRNDSRVRERRDRDLRFWRRKLAGAIPFQLPADFASGTRRSFRGRIDGWSIPGEELTALRSLAAREGATTFSLLLAAFGLVVAARTGMNDVAVGTLTAGRSRPETEPLIGLFVNPIVLRLALRTDMPFHDALSHARDVAVEALEHDSAPFQHVVRAVAPPRDGDRDPLTQVALIVHNVPSKDAEFCDLHLEQCGYPVTTANFDLAIYASETASGAIVGVVEYRSDVIAPESATQIVDELKSVLRAANADASAPVAESLRTGGRARATMRKAVHTDECIVRRHDNTREIKPWQMTEADTSNAMHLELSKRITAIWQSELRCADAQLDDDAFEMGGDSLSIARVWARVVTELGTAVPLRDLVAAPTLRSLLNQVRTVNGQA